MPTREPFVIDEVSYAPRSSMGEGGSAVVWKVHRKPDETVFAIKRITKDPKEGSVRNKRFEQEIEYGRTTTHPNILRIHACSEDEKYYYYVMDFYPITLREVINKESDPDLLLDYARQLCEALAHIHSDGIVHRDLKPENILVDSDARRLVIADFGIAHFRDSALTKRSDLLVNRNYLAPEQMLRNNALDVGKPADIFALGLVITEMFTKQNARGRRHALVRDRYPFLADLDPIVEQMMVQDEAQRLRIDTVHGLIRVLLRRLEATIVDSADDMRPSEVPAGVSSDEFEQTLDRSARDMLSAKYVFERVADEELSRFNLNYHCEISYEASSELFNACAQAVVYSLCKAKFDYEGAGSWDERDDASVSSPSKKILVRELDSILVDFPLPTTSLWNGLPRQSAHLFRFLKDYHCEELLKSIRSAVYGGGTDGLRTNLINAPILWIIRSMRNCLSTDYLELDRTTREAIQVEYNLSVLWSETLPLDLARKATGTELFTEPLNAGEIADSLDVLESRWGVTVGEVVGGNYSVMFRSRERYLRFRDEVLGLTERDSVFEADVLNLLRPEVEYDDLVALTWNREFDVAVTLGKVLGTRAS